MTCYSQLLVVILAVFCTQCKQRMTASNIQSEKAIARMHASMLQGLCIEETHKPTSRDLKKNKQSIANTLIHDFFGDNIQNLEANYYSDSDFIQVIGSDAGIKNYELTIKLAAMPDPEFQLYQIALAYDLDVNKLKNLKNKFKHDANQFAGNYDTYIKELSNASQLNPVGLRRFEIALRDQYSTSAKIAFSDIIHNEWLTWREVKIPLTYEFTSQIIKENPMIYKTFLQIIKSKFLDYSKQRDLAYALSKQNPLASLIKSDDSVTIESFIKLFRNAITELVQLEKIETTKEPPAWGSFVPEATTNEIASSYNTPFEVANWLDTTERTASRKTKEIQAYCNATYGSYCSRSPDTESCNQITEDQCTKPLSFIAEAILQIRKRGTFTTSGLCQNKYCKLGYRGLTSCGENPLETKEMYPIFSYQERVVPSAFTFQKNFERSNQTKDSLFYFGNTDFPFINTPVDSPLISNFYRLNQGVKLQKLDLIMLANGLVDPQLTYVINENLGIDQPPMAEPTAEEEITAEKEPSDEEAIKEDEDTLKDLADDKLRDSLRKNGLLDKEKLEKFKDDETIKNIMSTYLARLVELKKAEEEKNKDKDEKEGEPTEAKEQEEDEQPAHQPRTFFNFVDVDPFNLAINLQEDEFEFYKDHVMKHIPVRIAKNTNSYRQAECLETLIDAANPNNKTPIEPQNPCFADMFKDTDLAQNMKERPVITFYKSTLTSRDNIPFSVFK